MTLNVERLARAFDLNGVNWPKRWGDNDFAWLARQVAAEYSRLSTQDGRLTGADIESAIHDVTPFHDDPSLSEVDWDAVAVELETGRRDAVTERLRADKLGAAATELSAALAVANTRILDHEPEILGNCDAEIVLGCSCGWRDRDGVTWLKHLATPVTPEGGEL